LARPFALLLSPFLSFFFLRENKLLPRSFLFLLLLLRSSSDKAGLGREG